MEGEQIQTLQLNPGTMKPTGSRSLLPRGVYYPARGDVGCSGARGSLPDSTSSTPSRDTTRRLLVVVVVRPPHRHPPHTPRNQTLQKGWAPCKTRSLAAAEQPFPRRSARSGGCTKPGRQLERTGEHGREAVPGASGRGPWGRGGERGGEGGGRAGRPGSAPRPPGSHCMHPAAGRAPTPAAGTEGGRGCAEPPGRADPERITYPSPRRGTGPGGGARRVPSVSATLSSTPHPVAVVVVFAAAAAAVELRPPRFRWAITLFHTRPTHSGNGSERRLSAQAPRRGQPARSSPSSCRGPAMPHCAGAGPRQ